MQNFWHQTKLEGNSKTIRHTCAHTHTKEVGRAIYTHTIHLEDICVKRLNGKGNKKQNHPIIPELSSNSSMQFPYRV